MGVLAMRNTAKWAMVLSVVCVTSALRPGSVTAWQAVSRGRGSAVAVAPGGDAIAGGDGANGSAFNAGFKVIRLAGGSGAERWQYRPPFGGPANAVAVDPAGDVLAAGA